MDACQSEEVGQVCREALCLGRTVPLQASGHLGWGGREKSTYDTIVPEEIS